MIYYIVDCTLLERLLSQKLKDVSLKHLYFTEMEQESRTAMFTMLYKAFLCSKVKHRNKTRNQSRNVYNALKGFFVFHHGTDLFLCSKKTLYIHRNGTRIQNHNVYNALQGFFVFHHGTDLLFSQETLLEAVDM